MRRSRWKTSASPSRSSRQAIIPDRTTDETKLADALGKLVRDDPTLKCRTDPETKQLILSGMGELHLEVSVEKLMRNPGVKVTVGKPMVAYRQTLSKAVEIETRYIKQSGGRGKFAVIYMRFEPLTKEQVEEWTTYQEEQGEKPDPNNIYFIDKIVGGVVPGEYIPSVEAGFRDGLRQGRQVRLPVRRHAGDAAWTASITTSIARRMRSSWRRWNARATP